MGIHFIISRVLCADIVVASQEISIDTESAHELSKGA
jgi:hypothetical protein